MGKKSGPSPPDPVATANAQASANIDAAHANTLLNNANTVGPYGSVTYNQTGSQMVGGAINPETGQMEGQHEIPTFTVNTQLSPTEQALYDQSSALSLNALGTGNQLLGNVADQISQPYQLPDNPAMVSNVQGGAIQGGVNAPNVQWQLPQAPGVQYGWNDQQSQRSIQDPGAIQRQIDPSFEVQAQVQKSPINSTFSPGAAVQGQIDINGLPTRPGATDFSQDRDRYFDAFMSRQDQDLESQRAALEQRLANQGIAYGSEAWNNAMDDQNRRRTDAVNQAYLNAGQEQSRMFGLESQARGQAFGEQQAMGSFANQAQGQQYAQNLGRAQFQNQAADQRFQQELGAGNFQNQAQQQVFAQNAAQQAANNQAQQQQYAQNVGRADLYNRGTAQDFDFDRALADFYNQSQQQQFTQGLQGQQFANQAAGQYFDQNLAAAGFNNQAQGQQFAQDQANAALQNQARQQAIQESLIPRQELINEVTQLFGLGGDVNLPQFQQYGSQINPADIMGATYNSANLAQQRWQQQQQSRNALIGSLAQMGSAGMMGAFMSDRRMKRDIERISGSIGGFPVYRFRYLDGTPSVGVMAQEVMVTRPDAVIEHGGVLYVDYGRL